MKTITTLMVAAVLLWVPSVVTAQDAEANPSIAVGSWKCKFSTLDEFVQKVESTVLPIAQELVDEGSILGYGVMTHHWGDEWNFVDYTVAENAEATISASREMLRRARERNLEDRIFIEYCSEHKDNIYRIAASTEGPLAPVGENPPVLAVSSWKCPLGELGDILSAQDTTALVVLQDQLTGGALQGAGFLVHEWGDEWTLHRYVETVDLGGLEAAFNDYEERMEAHGFEAARIAELCSEHKDNIYQIRMRTRPPSNN